MNALNIITKDCEKNEVFEFSIGDTVRVSVKIKEGAKERIQAFEGVVISKRGFGISSNFTVRRIAHGVGVERIFPIHSPNVQKVEIIKKGKVRRAKLYYLRNRIGKAVRIKEKIN